MDKALKQRLVGASVLLALAVVVLPMLLGGAPDALQDSRPIDLPPKPQELTFDTRRFPVGQQEPDAPSVLAQQSPAPSPSAPAEAVPGNAETPMEATAEDSADVTAEGAAEGQAPELQALAETPAGPAAEVAEPAPDATLEVLPTATADVLESAVPADAVTGRYLVQVASFSSTANANRLSERLRGEGLPVLLDTIDSAAGRLHRVRIGPYDDAGAAEAALAQVKAGNTDINPRMIDLRPDESAPVSDPSDPLVRWVVQVGSFGAAENAEALVFRLRDAGYRASSVQVSGATGIVYKVQVGPVVEREEAVRLAAGLRTELRLDGLVMSAE